MKSPNQDSASKEYEEFLKLPEINFQENSNNPYQVGDQIRLNGTVIQKDWTLTVPSAVKDYDQPMLLGFWINSNQSVLLLKSGELTIPALAIKDTSGTLVARTGPLILNISSKLDKSKKEDQELVPMKDVIETPRSALLEGVVSGLGVIFTILMAWFLLRLWNKRKLLKSTPKIIDEEVEVLDRLKKISEQNYLEINDFKKYYFAVSEALKVYISKRYKIPAEEMTSSELSTELKQLLRSKVVHYAEPHLDDQNYDQVCKIFEDLDLVKFTDFLPTISEAKLLLNEVIQLVQNTKVDRVLLAKLELEAKEAKKLEMKSSSVLKFRRRK